jgi:hypothetical protein
MDRNTLTMPDEPIVSPFVGGTSPSNDAILDRTCRNHTHIKHDMNSFEKKQDSDMIAA